MGFVEAARNPRQGFGTVKSRVRQNVSGTVRNGRNIADAEYPVRVTKNPVHASGRDFYFLLLTSSLLLHNKDFHGIFGK